MNDITEIIQASSPILIATCMTVVGWVLKQLALPNKWIPLALLILGALGYMGLEGWTYHNAILGGTIAGLGAVGGNQLLRQTLKKE